MIKAVWIALLALAVGAKAEAPVPAAPPDAATLNKLSARLAPVDLTVDVAGLPAGERDALAQIIRASQIMEALYLRQVWAGNPALLLDLVRDRSPASRRLPRPRHGDADGLRL